MSSADVVDAIEAALRRRYRVVETSVVIGPRTLSILHPASAEELIDERDFERDERLPYWAELWPSCRVLGERVLGMSGDGRLLLELGCGSGVVSVCAAIAGFRVVVSDYYDDAVRFARVNVRRNTDSIAGGLLLDWRHLPPELQRCDVVVASDVLYEQPYGEIVARAVDATLAPEGIALIADPGRVGRDGFVRGADARGLVIRRQLDLPFVEGTIRQTIRVFEIGRS
ncbi:MAG TPA: methyltransferase domain-containing protein [Gemmatimonadaceae bacterium]|nr:methyltransferase domain-containing protein [Gemmatimonadaceae bacterium]